MTSVLVTLFLVAILVALAAQFNPWGVGSFLIRLFPPVGHGHRFYHYDDLD